MRIDLTMRTLLLALAVGATVAHAQAPDPYLARAHAVLKAVPLIDGHNDLPWAIRTDTIARGDVSRYPITGRARGHTDIPRLRAGGVGGQFWSVYIPGTVGDSGFAKMQLEQIDIAHQVIANHPDVFMWALTASDLWTAHGAGRIGSLLGIEGGHAIENSLGALRAYYALGVRYMTLTHSVNIPWADAATDSVRIGGLSRFGHAVLAEMNRLGMLVDLSHTSPGVMSDVLDRTAAPVMFSHSSARGVTDHPRNVPDSILARMPANGGVVMVTFVPGFVSQAQVEWGRARAQALADVSFSDPARRAAAERAYEAATPRPRATLRDVVEHIEHVRRVAGVDHVGLGGDFDGITELVEGLEDVSTYPALLAELARRGWSDADLRKLAGENILRVIETNERVAARLQRERAPGAATFDRMAGTSDR
jgi:membrane dipeptidase